MNMDANPFALAEFVENPEPRCPCLLLLDVSASMSGRRIQELNQGLKGFEASLKADSLSARRVEVAIVTFGDVQVYQDFTSAAHFIAPELHAEGLTPMGEAVEAAIHLLRHRKNLYRQAGISYYRPWIFMITDGTPTDNIANARAAIEHGEAGKEFMFYAVGVEDADMSTLGTLAKRQPLRLKGLAFRELFAWLSSSLSSQSRSNPGDAVALTNPTGPNGWATID